MNIFIFIILCFKFLNSIDYERLNSEILNFKTNLIEIVGDYKLLYILPIKFQIRNAEIVKLNFDYVCQSCKKTLKNLFFKKFYIFKFKHRINLHQYTMVICKNCVKMIKEKYDLFVKSNIVYCKRTLNVCKLKGCYQMHYFLNSQFSNKQKTMRKSTKIYDEKIKNTPKYCLDVILPVFFFLDRKNAKHNQNIKSELFCRKFQVNQIFNCYFLFEVFKTYDNILDFCFVRIFEKDTNIKHYITNSFYNFFNNDFEFLIEFNKIMSLNMKDKKYTYINNNLEYISTNLILIHSIGIESYFSNIVSAFKNDFLYIFLTLHVLYKFNKSFFDFLVNPKESENIEFDKFESYVQAYINFDFEIKNELNKKITKMYEAKISFPELIRILFVNINSKIKELNEIKKFSKDYNMIEKYDNFYIVCYTKNCKLRNIKKNRIIRIEEGINENQL